MLKILNKQLMLENLDDEGIKKNKNHIMVYKEKLNLW